MKYAHDDCRRYAPVPLTRRSMLARCAGGFGALACASLMYESAMADRSRFSRGSSHFKARARSVIYLQMDGGVSHVDTFDPKPRLHEEHGQKMKFLVAPTQFNSVGPIMESPWSFQQYGESGLAVSELFPHIARCADELCVVRSMVSDFSEHAAANYFLHTGFADQGHPSAGAWVSYGLGSENKNLPAFLVLNGGQLPTGGAANYANGFLPATHQASLINLEGEAISNISPADRPLESQREKLDFVAQCDRRLLERLPEAIDLEAAIVNQELAFRMQTAVPGIVDVQAESEATCRLYGMDSPNRRTQLYAKQCLLARRMVERGVRFVQLTMPVGQNESSRWDQHAKIRVGHAQNALAIDQPIAALLIDLRSRGLLDETLVLWAGEFGRTPFAQGDGRDHHPYGFSIWLAGGGVRRGITYGATDEYGYHAVENRVHIHDLHATILYLLGLDHTQLRFHFGGRDFRLTDVAGHVVAGIIS